MVADPPSANRTYPLWATEKRSTLVYWPVEVDAALARLQELAAQAGEPCSRAQLLAALVMATSQDGDELVRLLHRYRELRSNTDGAQPAPKRARGPRSGSALIGKPAQEQ